MRIVEGAGVTERMDRADASVLIIFRNVLGGNDVLNGNVRNGLHGDLPNAVREHSDFVDGVVTNSSNEGRVAVQGDVGNA